MPSSDIRQSILDLLQKPTFENIKKLFWTELNYDQVNAPLSRAGWADAAATALADDPVLFASGGSDNDFHILYARLASDRLLLGHERPVIARLLREHPYALFVFSNNQRDRWHFVNVKDAQRAAEDERQGRKPRMLFRRFTIGRDERLRTAAQQIARMDLRALAPQLWGIPPLEIQRAHDDAFDVEALTDTFFKEYVLVFGDLQKRVGKQVKDKVWAHDYALQLLNRLMFLYFIQRKRWLGDDPDFIRNFWETYQDSKRPRDTFFQEWLSILFFEAFNNKFQAGRRDLAYLPEQFRNALQLAPYLNGGLFSRNLLDEREFNVPDAFFETIFDRFDGKTPGLFERYNFTIAEDTPFDQEVAVDPEMIGKVYESLVNVTSEGVEDGDDLRADAGIVYSPRVEIDMMCRLALLDYLSNHIGEKYRTALRDAVFAYDPEEKQAADAALAKLGLWTRLDEFLRTVTALDITCGSGSFLVGMLGILDDLIARANHQVGRTELPYGRRKRIIGSSLYGVDVMQWAVQVAELRLWLQLIVETELDLGERKAQPLLPNLSFKIRAGDSLVQEVGGLNFSHHTYQNIPATLKGRLTALKNEKIKFFNNDDDRKFRTQAQLENEELAVFKSILLERETALKQQIRQLDKDIEKPPVQMGLMGIEQKPQAEQLKMIEQFRDMRDAAQAQLDEIQTALGALRTEKRLPFVWDIAFVEIFLGEREGFDILVGNPPYVRQERIAPPNEREENYSTEKWKELKKEYKEKLQRAVAAAYPRFFGYKPAKRQIARKLDGKSDLYIYFYLYGLSLLNSSGAFCFITSNSWLDVGYGAELQEFLLKHSQVRLIIDNQVKRSFKQADVNTVIALLSPADDHHANGLGKTARFVMFKTPFESVLSSIVFGEIEEAKERVVRPEFRVIVKTQNELLQEGMISPQDDLQTADSQYRVCKWGGKYLRAPDVFWSIFEKCRKHLVQLDKVAKVEFGIKTGANEFFFLDENRVKEWGVESEFLVPALKNARDVDRIAIEKRMFPLKLFLCNRTRAELKGTNAFEYIRWGESMKFQARPSCKGRQRWWDLGKPNPAHINCNYQIGYVQHYFVSERSFYVSNNFQVIHYEQNPFSLAAALNSSWTQLWVAIMGRTNFGGGLLKIETYETAGIITVNPSDVSENEAKAVVKNGGIFEIDTPDRKELDTLVFDSLKLTRGERDGIKEALIDLISVRLTKADSLNHKANYESDED